MDNRHGGSARAACSHVAKLSLLLIMLLLLLLLLLQVYSPIIRIFLGSTAEQLTAKRAVRPAVAY
jgi:hypothetical protein